MRATGVGSLPGTDAFEAARIVAGELPDFMHLVELPHRGPGADVVGRAAALIDQVTGEFALDTTPLGWRVADAAGRTMRRARAWFAEDLDALEATSQGYRGPVKVQIAGPWTLAAKIEARSGQRLVSDPGACRELAQALATTTQWLVAEVRRRVSDEVFVQFDESSLSAVAAGAIHTASSLSRYQPIDAATLQGALQLVFTATRDAGAHAGVHAAEPGTPWPVVLAGGAQFVSFDMLHGCPSDHDLGTLWEAGCTLLAGSVSAADEYPISGRVASAPIRAVAERLGLADDYGSVVVTPATGLAFCDTQRVKDAYRACQAAARILRDEREHDE